MSALRELLASYRSASRTEREKDSYFELLFKDFLKNDPTYSPAILSSVYIQRLGRIRKH
ncbi:hypothetical protein C8R27_13625 [Nitrosomonas ureae]|uniref:hypothetical protein n=1 Tax=Nitrosomonas ureae TaxID=44577 RepID=UPI000D8A23AE|nr:hypothetical protein [Nitrosomonas ureae]PXX09524.1 hypothetical protein C8R27_13625 [Nitrosomonas ureae]